MRYAELIFIESFFQECFILFFVTTLLRVDPSRKRIFDAAYVFGVISVFYPVVPQFVMIVKYLFSFFIAPVFCLRRTLKNIFLFIGTCSFLLFFEIPILFSAFGLLLLICLKNIPHKSTNVNKNYYECILTVSGKKVGAVAFFDSGNRIYSKNGEPVVLADNTVYNKFDGEEQNVCFSTLTGMGVTTCRSGSVSVYYNGKWIDRRAMIAKSPKKINHYGVILHGDMLS